MADTGRREQALQESINETQQLRRTHTTGQDDPHMHRRQHAYTLRSSTPRRSRPEIKILSIPHGDNDAATIISNQPRVRGCSAYAGPRSVDETSEYWPIA